MPIMPTESSIQNMGYPHPLCAREGRPKMSLWGRWLRSELSKERATRLEGSFGTQKQHYSLARIKARNRKTEILWIFFGIHTKCHIDDSQDQEQNGESCMIWVYWKNQKRSEDFFRSFMSCPIRVYENIRKNDNNNGIWSDYTLSSSYAMYFVGTFTEYH